MRLSTPLAVTLVALASLLPAQGGAIASQGAGSAFHETMTIDTALAHPAKTFEAFDTASLSLYDFNGDGQMEIVSNNDNNHFYVLDSRTGAVLFEANTSHPGGNAWPVRDINPIAEGNLMGDGRPCMVVPSDAARLAAWCYDAALSTPTSFNFTKEWDIVIDAALYEPNFKQSHPWMYYPDNGTLMPQYQVGSDGDAFMADVDGTGCKYVFAETDGYPGQLAFDCHGHYKWSVSWFDGNAGATVVDLMHDGHKSACFASDAGEIACYDAKTGASKWIFRARDHGAYPGSVPVAPAYADLYGNGQLYTFFGARNAVWDPTNPTADPLMDQTGNDSKYPNWINDSHAVYYELDPHGNMVWNVSYDWMNPLTYNHPASIDVNGDGVLDFVVLDWNTIGHKPGNWETTNRSSNLFALDGRDGSLIWRTGVPIYWSNKDFVIADADGDGKMDVICDEPKLGLDGLGVYDLATGKEKGWFPFGDGWGVNRGPVAGDLYGDGHLYLVVPAAKRLTTPNYRSLDVGYREGELHVVDTGQAYDVKFSANFQLSDDQKDVTQHGSGGAGPTKPGAPQNVVATASGPDVMLSWAPPPKSGGAAVTGYVVYRDGQRAANVSATSWTDAGAPTGTHTYTVAAVNSVGEGDASSAATATVSNAPPPSSSTPPPPSSSTPPTGTTPSTTPPSGTPASPTESASTSPANAVPFVGVGAGVAVLAVAALALRKRG
ncbi:MAG: hypothetical protein QOE90_2330 [Thermoplasmata archaeon]|jgi:outer membrane protein assembly factor BamB|nr:hypothetical protein [Thermoplasmata archaeon]